MTLINLAIVTPVFNDWNSFQALLRDIDAHLTGIVPHVAVFAVDDGSTESFQGVEPAVSQFSVIKTVQILHLARNAGHQRAIAIGLAYLEKNFSVERVVIMDSDGEDSPADLPKLIEEQQKNNQIIFARRGKRSENFVFRFYYVMYRFLFHLLTGKQIAFGNFCIIPGHVLRQVVFLPEIWGHFASGILRSGLAHRTIVVDRKKRYHGKSKMNFQSLVMHGLNAFSVYTDVLAVRLILATLVVIVAAVLGAGVLVYIRYFTVLAIPGWATTVGFGLVMILLQSLLLLLSLAFNVIQARNSQTYIPAKHFEDFLLRIADAYKHD